MLLRCVHSLRVGSQVQVSSRTRCVEVWIVNLRCSGYVLRRRAKRAGNIFGNISAEQSRMLLGDDLSLILKVIRQL